MSFNLITPKSSLWGDTAGDVVRHFCSAIGSLLTI